jgi:hypothetical protein
MANWTAIADATLEPGKPIRAIDARALRDNPIAISEGASGAPKIQTAGITDLNVTTAKLAAGAVTTAKITDANVTAAKLATGNNERDWVLARTAGAAVGAVGTYAWLRQSAGTGTDIIAGTTYAGSGLRYFGPDSETFGATPSGTWRAMGTVTSTQTLPTRQTLFLRIS